MWQGRTLPLDHVGPNRWEEEKRKRKERGKKEKKVEREISPSVSVEARGKVLPLDKSFK